MSRMLKTVFQMLVVVSVAAYLTACQQLPGTRTQQGAVIGGAAGAATGAAVASGHRGLGAVIGGLLGAGAGYVVAAKTDKIDSKDQAGATAAARKAQERPATAMDARNATTADLNNDGFVTLDEVVAMKQAGFSDNEMIRRLQATDQVFDLTSDQQQYLRDRGVDQTVISQMLAMNRGRVGTTTQPAPVVGQPQ